MRVQKIIPILLILTLLGCEEDYYPYNPTPASYVVSIAAAPPGAKDAECYDYSDETSFYTIHAAAVDDNGLLVADYEKPARITITEGELTVAGGDQDDILQFEAGEALAVVGIRRAFGANVRIWVEDALKQWHCTLDCGEPDYWGEKPYLVEGDEFCCGEAAPEGGSLFENVTVRSPTHVAGCSERICFKTPTFRNIQETDHEYFSPLDGNSLSVSRGTLLVTAVEGDGFYVTDICPDTIGSPAGFNHLYAYNYSHPQGVAVGDVIREISGIVQEWRGFTELGFPLWQKEIRSSGDVEDITAGCGDEHFQEAGVQCAGTDLVAERGSNVVTSNNLDFLACGAQAGDRLVITISSYENDIDVIDIVDVDAHSLTLALPMSITRSAMAFYINRTADPTLFPPAPLHYLDFNDPLNIERFESGLVEVEGARIGFVDTGDYARFGQWPIEIGPENSGVELVIVSQSTIPRLNPRQNTDVEIDRLAGVLRQHRAAGWIMHPRGEEDICCPACTPALTEGCHK